MECLPEAPIEYETLCDVSDFAREISESTRVVKHSAHAVSRLVLRLEFQTPETTT